MMLTVQAGRWMEFWISMYLHNSMFICHLMLCVFVWNVGPREHKCSIMRHMFTSDIMFVCLLKWCKSRVVLLLTAAYHFELQLHYLILNTIHSTFTFHIFVATTQLFTKYAHGTSLAIWIGAVQKDTLILKYNKAGIKSWFPRDLLGT